jgi:hypothetical protein
MGYQARELLEARFSQQKRTESLVAVYESVCHSSQAVRAPELLAV